MQSATLALLAAVTFLVVLVLAIWDLINTTKDLPKESLESAEIRAFNAMSHDGESVLNRAQPQPGVVRTTNLAGARVG